MVLCFQKSFTSLVKCCIGGCKIYRGRKQNCFFQCKRFLMYVIMLVHMIAVELLGWKSPMETPQQRQSQLR